MSFLAPLYLLAGLAVGLPILFHLIRQTPKGKQVFSSVMFLSPTPPKVTKRSRVEDWLLLLLRALAICLLALAFARPFFRSLALANAEQKQGDRILFLIDTSASMQREGHWEETQTRFVDELNKIQPEDSVALVQFDGEIQPHLSFDYWNQLAPAQRMSELRTRLDSLQPGWNRTSLGEAMIAAAEMLNEDSSENTRTHRLVVISDLQAGSDWQPLNGYGWPENVAVRFVRIGDDDSTNAALQVVADDDLSDNILRVRVTNSETADRDLFHLHWQDIFASDDTEFDQDQATSVYVPPGQSRVVQAPEPPLDFVTQRLVLTGDDETFDNTCYVARTEPWEVNILYAGDADTSVNGLYFFLKPVFASTVNRNVTIELWDHESDNSERRTPTLLVVGGELSEAQLIWTRDYLNDGGCGFFVARNATQAQQLYMLLNLPAAEIGEADLDDYSMLGDVDLTFPPLQQFDDPRYADFTKLRYWKHRVFDEATLPKARIFAKHDGGAPAFVELPVGAGKVFLFSAGWDRDDSDLAVWSKFVPLMNALLEYGTNQHYERPQYTVGDLLPHEKYQFIHSPDGKEIRINSELPARWAMPGLYKLADSKEALMTEKAVTFAVNLPSAESNTAPLSLDVLKATGITLDDTMATAENSHNTLSPEQLRNQELEAQQQLWKWLLCAALAALALETLISTVKTRRKQQTIAN